jgi:hypothetical protein
MSEPKIEFKDYKEVLLHNLDDALGELNKQVESELEGLKSQVNNLVKVMKAHYDK